MGRTPIESALSFSKTINYDSIGMLKETLMVGYLVGISSNFV